MDLGLAGKRALVLGSSMGLGRAVARSLADEGAHVAVTSRVSSRATAAAQEIGAKAALVVDLTEWGAGDRIVADAVSALGGLDICVVNTGGGKPGGIMATGGFDDAAYASMLRPALEVSRAAAPYLREAPGGGRLSFMTARSVVEATPDLALSSVFRSGVAAMARSLAIELAPDVNVTVVITGQFATGGLERFEAARASAEGRSAEEVHAEHLAGIPLGRVGRAEELADVVAFLCSERASFVTGTAVRIDGGAVTGF
jgi:NAD(P)-dependent dehydrogenase (short-subunit alcohol dehydrogenase family)